MTGEASCVLCDSYDILTPLIYSAFTMFLRNSTRLSYHIPNESTPLASSRPWASQERYRRRTSKTAITPDHRLVVWIGIRSTRSRKHDCAQAIWPLESRRDRSDSLTYNIVVVAKDCQWKPKKKKPTSRPMNVVPDSHHKHTSLSSRIVLTDLTRSFSPFIEREAGHFHDAPCRPFYRLYNYYAGPHSKS